MYSLKTIGDRCIKIVLLESKHSNNNKDVFSACYLFVELNNIVTPYNLYIQQRMEKVPLMGKIMNSRPMKLVGLFLSVSK